MNAYVHFLKCSPKNNMLFFMTTTQMEGWKPKQMEV